LKEGSHSNAEEEYYDDEDDYDGDQEGEARARGNTFLTDQAPGAGGAAANRCFEKIAAFSTNCMLAGRPCDASARGRLPWRQRARRICATEFRCAR